jgi:hypothetical protein
LQCDKGRDVQAIALAQVLRVCAVGFVKKL